MQKRYYWLNVAIVGFLILLLCFILVPRLSIGLIQSQCPECDTIDAIQIASQIGRLDVISLVLGMLGLGIGAFAIFSFLALKEEARKGAKVVADEYLKKEFFRLESQISDMVESQIERRLGSMAPSSGGEAGEKGAPTPSQMDVGGRVKEEGSNE